MLYGFWNCPALATHVCAKWFDRNKEFSYEFMCIYIFFAMIDTTSKITLSNILIKGLLYCFTLLSLSAKDARSKHLIVGAGAQSTYLYIIWHCEGHVPWIVHMLLIILKWIWTIAYDSQFDMYIYIYIWFYAHRYRCISYPLFQGVMVCLDRCSALRVLVELKKSPTKPVGFEVSQTGDAHWAFGNPHLGDAGTDGGRFVKGLDFGVTTRNPFWRDQTNANVWQFWGICPSKCIVWVGKIR